MINKAYKEYMKIYMYGSVDLKNRRAGTGSINQAFGNFILAVILNKV